MPPRSGKSEFASKYFPAYLIGKIPTWKVILASYEAEFAASWGRKVRDLLSDHGQRLFGVTVRQDSKAADRWEVAQYGGGMQTCGIGGSLTGRGGQCLICDDPIKNSEEANSELVKQKLFEWYQTTFYTRLEPQGSIILIQTRWAEDDLAGRVLERAKETGEKWTVVNFPALAEADDILGRAVGEPLWPERYSAEDIQRIKGTLTSYQFAALYQQRPSPEGGGLFKRSWFKYYDKVGDYYRIDGRSYSLAQCRTFVVVDLAFSVKAENDWTVIQAWAVTPECDQILLDVHRERMTGDQLAPSIKNMVAKWNADYAGIEDVQAQTLVVQTMRRQGIAVRALKANMDKITRSIPLQIRYEAGQVWHPRSHPHLESLEHELLTFPKGTWDDQVDCAAYSALEVQRFGAAALSQEEIDRRNRERSQVEWEEKLARQREAHDSWEMERWWLDTPESGWN